VCVCARVCARLCVCVCTHACVFPPFFGMTCPHRSDPTMSLNNPTECGGLTCAQGPPFTVKVLRNLKLKDIQEVAGHPSPDARSPHRRKGLGLERRGGGEGAEEMAGGWLVFCRFTSSRKSPERPAARGKGGDGTQRRPWVGELCSIIDGVAGGRLLGSGENWLSLPRLQSVFSSLATRKTLKQFR